MISRRISFIVGLTLFNFHIITGEQCNWQFFQHYEQKGCRPELDENGCPLKFHCEQLSYKDLSTCVHKGKIYKVGESIKDLGPCDSCSCTLGEGSAYIECDEVDCPDWEAKNKSCYMGYKPNGCCPEEICPKGNQKPKVCKHNGKEYRIGEYIKISKPCRTCICTEEWTDEDGPGCSDVDCLTGIYAKKLRNGCLPIYFENRCCLFGVDCGGIHGAIPVTPLEEHRGDYCQYRGRYYKKGSIAFLDSDKYQCIECKCLTPPDFTCLRKACPPRPREDCTPVYGHCCPKYECPKY